MIKLKIIYIAISLAVFAGCKESVNSPLKVAALPVLYPDYVGVTVPVSIAPLNFSVVKEEFDLIDVEIKGLKSGSMHVQDDKMIQFPEKKWKRLLNENKGSAIKVTVCLKSKGAWKQYQSFNITISSYPIDHGLVYRMIAPGYEVYSKMGIYQRDLSSFKQKAIVENTLMPGTCVNCHAFNKNNPETMNLHIRGDHGGTMIKIDGKMEMYNTKTDSTMSNCVYPYWHTSGKYIAYSVNQTRQAFHVVRNERIEVFDEASDVMVLDIKSKQLFTSALLKTDDFETFPVFSPDGLTMYFCSSKKQNVQTGYKNIKYSLCKIAFNPQNGTFGDKVDTLVSAALTNKSISFPRPSFDGRYLMFTQSDYGNFSIWHREADLFLMDLKVGFIRSMPEVNSSETESFHDWSSNSHWFVFSSRRGDGLYTRLYLASIDDNGKISKPFLLPQKDPFFYDKSLFSYNVPEFISSEVKVDITEFEERAVSKERQKITFKEK